MLWVVKEEKHTKVLEGWARGRQPVKMMVERSWKAGTTERLSAGIRVHSLCSVLGIIPSSSSYLLSGLEVPRFQLFFLNKRKQCFACLREVQKKMPPMAFLEHCTSHSQPTVYNHLKRALWRKRDCWSLRELISKESGSEVSSWLQLTLLSLSIQWRYKAKRSSSRKDAVSWVPTQGTMQNMAWVHLKKKEPSSSSESWSVKAGLNQNVTRQGGTEVPPSCNLAETISDLARIWSPSWRITQPTVF